MFDPSISPQQLLSTFLTHILDLEQRSQLPDTAEAPSAAERSLPVSERQQSPGVSATGRSLGNVYVMEMSKKKDLRWLLHKAEVKREQLILQPVGEAHESDTQTPNAPPTGLRQTLRDSLRRTNSMKRMSLVPLSAAPSSRPDAASDSSSSNTLMILLTGARLQNGAMVNSDTGRYPFAVVDALGVMHSLEVESSAKRDEWIAAIEGVLKGGLGGSAEAATPRKQRLTLGFSKSTLPQPAAQPSSGARKSLFGGE